jgi:hypothetical protein
MRIRHSAILRAAASAVLLSFVPLAFTATGCGRSHFGTGWSFRKPAIPESEALTYRVIADGDSIGTHRMVVRKGYFKDVPSFMIELVTRTTTGSMETVDSSVVFVSQDTIAPLSSFRFVRAGSALVATAANYGDGSVAVTTFAGEEEQQKMLPSQPKTFDVDQLTFLGRTVTLGLGSPAKFNVVIPIGPPAGGSVMKAQFEAVGDEMVTVPAGSFDCRKITLSVGENQVELWYEKAPAQRLIRYNASEARMAFELVGAAMAEYPIAPVSE